MNKLFYIFISCFLLSSTIVNAQQTVGLFLNDDMAFNGYTLFSPSSNSSVYLIDNCGFLINTWATPYNPGLGCYLLENGNLLRAARIGSNFNGGGSGGRIEIYDWDNNLVWGYDYSTTDYHQHHDVEYLPNGNILVLAWEARSNVEAIAAGRNPANVNNAMWAERIVELEPVGVNQINVVWEWHVWDHLIQDFDPAQANFGVVADHPELIDINNNPSVNPDWLHFNALDYNPDLDQIIMSSRVLSEILIIDHSTTSAEAAGHTGGNSGKGGDFLWRWGNPENYDRGTAADKQLFGQHNPEWIPAGYPNEGKITVYNNGQGRPGGSYSTIEMIDPPMDVNGNYIISPGQPFEPTNAFWTYPDTPDLNFYSSNISGTHALPNGNILICEGRDGRYFEVDMTGTMHWEYINPVINSGPVSQGTNANQNSTFRCYRYAPDFPGFIGKDLTPGDPVEVNPWASTCTIFENTPQVLVDIHVMLEGPYNTVSSLMNTALLDDSLLPLAQPFSGVPWNYGGSENVADMAAFPPTTVDWILVEVRDQTDNDLIIEQRAALLTANGQVLDIDGSIGVTFSSLTSGTEYYLSVKTRHHLAVLSANFIQLPNGSPYDFSDPANVAGGTSQLAELSNGDYGLYSGDWNSDGILSVADFNGYTSESGQVNQYADSDFNLDGNITVADFNFYQPNAGLIGSSQIRY